MIARLTFYAVAVFWLTMNVLLWREEFGSRGSDTPVPLELVWRKILTAPDASSLSVYQKGERMGYCELSTSIGREIATIDNDKPPPENLVARAGYQIHLAGNVALGDFTNRLKFDGRINFLSARQWRELNFKISSRDASLEIHSLATNQTVHVKISTRDGVLERDLPFADLQNPDALLRIFAGNLGGAFLGMLDLPDLQTVSATPPVSLQARRTRIKIAGQSVPIYRLETAILDHPVRVDVSTLGEILRVQLPGNISAHIDEIH